MKRNIIEKLRNWYLEKFKDTTREPEDEIELSQYSITVESGLKNRIRFLFTNELRYRLTKRQFRVINRNPMKEV